MKVQNLPVHNSAKRDEIAKIVLICGDPLRATYFSKNYLLNSKKVNKVRGINGYTGILKGTKLLVTVMGHGMGLESIGIYVYELFNYYEVDLIIRFGSAGAYVKNFNLGDLVIATSAWTESNYGLGFNFKDQEVEASSKLVKIAKQLKFDNTHFSKVHSSMWFYKTLQLPLEYFTRQNIKAVEMESYALYLIALLFQKNALTILTIADSLVTNESMNQIQREKGFHKMFNFLIEMVKLYGQK